jgi:hypothetical protein
MMEKTVQPSLPIRLRRRYTTTHGQTPRKITGEAKNTLRRAFAPPVQNGVNRINAQPVAGCSDRPRRGPGHWRSVDSIIKRLGGRAHSAVLTIACRLIARQI